jgi:hypothetical protein
MGPERCGKQSETVPQVEGRQETVSKGGSCAASRFVAATKGRGPISSVPDQTARRKCNAFRR